MSDERDFKEDSSLIEHPNCKPEIDYKEARLHAEGILQGDTIAVSFLGNYICSEGIAENINHKFRSFYGDKDEDGERLFFHSTEDCTVVLIKKVEDEEDND